MAEQTDDGATKAPTAFISYSHDSEEHMTWVGALAGDLYRNGVKAILDQWELRLGRDLPTFMEKIRAADKVCVVCTPKYASRAKSDGGGVGYEKQIITAEMYRHLDSDKVIPILKEGSEEEAIPIFLEGRLYGDFRNQAEYEQKLDELLRAILDAPKHKPPPLGHSPFDKDSGEQEIEPQQGDPIARRIREACRAENTTGDKLRSLDLRNLTHVNWDALPPLPALTHFDIRQCDIGNEETKVILSKVSTERLQKLTAVKNRLGNRSARAIAKFTGLLHLALDRNRIADHGVESLATLTRLQRLGLGDNISIGDEGIRAIRGLANLEALSVASTEITDDGVASLAHLSKKMTSLNIGNCRRITDATLEHLKDFHRLDRLVISGTEIGNEGIAHIKAMTSLTQLALTDTRVDNDGVQHLGRMTRLRRLWLNAPGVDDDGLEELSNLGLPVLEALDLRGIAITDNCLAYLPRLKNLRRVDLRNTKVTRSGIEKLQKVLPNVTIVA